MEFRELESEDLIIMPHKSPPRSPGLHVSTIISAINRELFHPEYKSEWDAKDTDYVIGFIWEEMLAIGFGELMAVRPGEVILDGIAMSPDGIDTKNWRLVEYKATRSSTKKCPSENWYWMTQLKAYMKGFGGGMDTAIMFIYYINGNWKPPKSKYKKYEFTFSQLEIDETWDMILNYAETKGWL